MTLPRSILWSAQPRPVSRRLSPAARHRDGHYGGGSRGPAWLSHMPRSHSEFVDEPGFESRRPGSRDCAIGHNTALSATNLKAPKPPAPG